jgi:hypothetical protein
MINAVGTQFGSVNNRNKNNNVSFGYGREILARLTGSVCRGAGTVSEKLKEAAAHDYWQAVGRDNPAERNWEQAGGILEIAQGILQRLKTGLVGTRVAKLDPKKIEGLVSQGSTDLRTLSNSGTRVAVVKINDGKVTPLIYDPEAQTLLRDEAVGEVPVAKLTRIKDEEGLYAIKPGTERTVKRTLATVFDALFGSREAEARLAATERESREKFNHAVNSETFYQYLQDSTKSLSAERRRRAREFTSAFRDFADHI